jgi:hypothetical protein
LDVRSAIDCLSSEAKTWIGFYKKIISAKKRFC